MKKIVCNEIKIGAILTYIRLFFSVLIGILYTPVMISLLGQSEYGLYNTVASITSLLSILNLGFGSGYQRYYAKYKAVNNTKKIYILNGMFLCIFFILALIASMCGIIISNNMTVIFDSGLSEQEYQLARILFKILMVQLVISLPMNVFTSIIQAHERFVFAKLLNLAKTVLSPMLTLPLLLLGYRSIAMVSVSLSISIVADIICIYYVCKVLGEKFFFSGFDKKIFVELLSYTAFVALHLITDQINWNVDKVLLGRFCGTKMVAVYAVGYSLYSYFIMIGTPVATLFVPRIHQIVAANSDSKEKLKEHLTDIFVMVGRAQFLIIGLIVSGITIFGRQFIFLWIGKGYEESYYVALLLILPGTIDLIQGIGTEIQRAQNLHKFRAYIYITMALVNMIISIPLCQKLGAVGSAIGTAISFIVVQGMIINIYYQKKCNLDILSFWRNIISIFKGMVIPISLGLLLCSLISEISWLMFIIEVIIYTITYIISIYWLGMNKQEKRFVQTLLKKRRRL